MYHIQSLPLEKKRIIKSLTGEHYSPDLLLLPKASINKKIFFIKYETAFSQLAIQMQKIIIIIIFAMRKQV